MAPGRDHLVHGETPHQHGADAEEERIAAGEHAYRAVAMGFDRVERVLDWRWPGERLGFQRSGEREVPLAANHKGRLRDEPPRGRSEAVEPVLADADEAKPAFASHGAAL